MMNRRYHSEAAGHGKAVTVANTFTSVLISGLLASGSAFAFSAEKMNDQYGRYVIVADVTPVPKAGALDISKKAPRSTESGQLAGAAVAGGASLGGSLAGAVLLDGLLSPPTYDSRLRMYRAIGEKECKLTRAFSMTTKADVTELVPGRFAQWIDPPSGGGAVLAALKDGNGKSVSKIDALHPCFPAYEAAVRAEAENSLAAKQTVAQ